MKNCLKSWILSTLRLNIRYLIKIYWPTFVTIYHSFFGSLRFKISKCTCLMILYMIFCMNKHVFMYLKYLTWPSEFIELYNNSNTGIASGKMSKLTQSFSTRITENVMPIFFYNYNLKRSSNNYVMILKETMGYGFCLLLKAYRCLLLQQFVSVWELSHVQS